MKPVANLSSVLLHPSNLFYLYSINYSPKNPCQTCLDHSHISIKTHRNLSDRSQTVYCKPTRPAVRASGVTLAVHRARVGNKSLYHSANLPGGVAQRECHSEWSCNENFVFLFLAWFYVLNIPPSRSLSWENTFTSCTTLFIPPPLCLVVLKLLTPYFTICKIANISTGNRLGLLIGLPYKMSYCSSYKM